MRFNENNGRYSAFIVALAALITLAACGHKDEKKKKESKAVIVDAKIDANGKANFSFQGTNTQCKFDTNDAKGEWYQCDGSTASYPLAPGQAGTFFVRSGSNGPISYQTISNPSYTQQDVAPAQQPQQQVATDAIQLFDNAGNIGLVNRKVQVPNGMYVTFYSTNNTLSTMLDVYQVDPSEDPFKRATNCNAAQMAPNMTSETVVMTSVPNGPAHRYCNTNPTEQFQKSFNNYRAGLNQIELVTEPGQAFNFISYAVYLKGQDEQTTNSLFVAQCGVPGRNVVGVLNSSFMPSAYAPVPAIPLLNDYFPGFFPQTAIFNWCQKRVTVRGKQTVVWVGGFKSFRRGLSSDMVEFVTIAELTPDLADPNSFAQHSATTVLNTLGMSVPGHL